jgi:hypothetical protein
VTYKDYSILCMKPVWFGSWFIYFFIWLCAVLQIWCLECIFDGLVIWRQGYLTSMFVYVRPKHTAAELVCFANFSYSQYILDNLGAKGQFNSILLVILLAGMLYLIHQWMTNWKQISNLVAFLCYFNSVTQLRLNYSSFLMKVLIPVLEITL